MSSHIDWREGRVPMKTLGLESDRLWDLTSVGKENKAFFVSILKREQYLLVVGLDYYTNTITFFFRYRPGTVWLEERNLEKAILHWILMCGSKIDQGVDR